MERPSVGEENMIEFLLGVVVGVGASIVTFFVLCRIVDWLFAEELELRT